MNNYIQVLRHIQYEPQTFQSNHFRGNASFYAEAASRGHISCLDGGRNTGKWRVTSSGAMFLSIYGGSV